MLGCDKLVLLELGEFRLIRGHLSPSIQLLVDLREHLIMGGASMESFQLVIEINW